MKKTLAIIVLLLAALGAGGFAFMQWKANASAKDEISQLADRAAETAKKQEEAEKEAQVKIGEGEAAKKKAIGEGEAAATKATLTAAAEGAAAQKGLVLKAEAEVPS